MGKHGIQTYRQGILFLGHQLSLYGHDLVFQAAVSFHPHIISVLIHHNSRYPVSAVDGASFVRVNVLQSVLTIDIIPSRRILRNLKVYIPAAFKEHLPWRKVFHGIRRDCSF